MQNALHDCKFAVNMARDRQCGSTLNSPVGAAATVCWFKLKRPASSTKAANSDMVYLSLPSIIYANECSWLKAGPLADLLLLMVTPVTWA